MLRGLTLTLATAVAFSFPLRASAPPPTPVETALDEAITKVRSMSYRRAAIDWTALEKKVRARARGARDLVDLLPALELLVEGLGDGHSHINVPPEDATTFKARYGVAFDAGRVVKRPTSPFMGRRETASKTVQAGRGAAEAVVVPMFSGGGAKAAAFADDIYRRIAVGAGQRCGYIIDLRGNGGGNVWPMLVGLSPLLGDRYNSYDQRPDGSRKLYATLTGGKAIIADKDDPNYGAAIVGIDVWRAFPQLARRPVAVLIDDAVGSSGEGVAVAFKGRAKTRFFGQNTYGLASSNEGFMVGDRINVVVTTGLMTDRGGRTYQRGISPDVVTVQPKGAKDPNDPAMLAAGQWLHASRSAGCNGSTRASSSARRGPLSVASGRRRRAGRAPVRTPARSGRRSATGRLRCRSAIRSRAGRRCRSSPDRQS